MEHRAFTVKGQGRFREIRTRVGLFPVASADQSTPDNLETFEGIWDTGATNTAIASGVAAKLKLTPIGYSRVGTGGGDVDNAPVHLLNVVLPNNVILPNVRVTELKDLNNCDVLIGMDIIAIGDFAVTHASGEACCSFRVPSHEQIDFVPAANRFNMRLRSKVGMSKKNKPKRKPRERRKNR